MHFHHRHDLPGCTEHHDDWPDWATSVLATLDRKMEQIMTATQDSIDNLAAQFGTVAADITAAVGAVQNELTVLQAGQGDPAPDLSGLQSAFEQVQSAASTLAALVPAAPAAPVDPSVPADPAPADPAAPTADGSAPADPAPVDPAADGTVPTSDIPSVPLS